MNWKVDEYFVVGFFSWIRRDLKILSTPAEKERGKRDRGAERDLDQKIK